MSLISGLVGAPIGATNQSAFPITPELTSIAVQYSNPAAKLIADKVMPMTPPMGIKKYKWTKYADGLSYTVGDLQIGPRSMPRQYDVSASEETSTCIDYGLEGFVTQDDIDEAAALRGMDQSIVDPRFTQTEVLTDVVWLGRELRVAGIVFNPANYMPNLSTNLQANNGQQQFDNQAQSHPIPLIDSFLDSCLMRPNQLTFGRVAWTALRSHPDIMKAVNRTAGDTGNATQQEVADLFEVGEVLVGDGWVNTSRDPNNPIFERCWGAHMAGTYCNPAAVKVKGMTWGYTANYRGIVAGELPDRRMGANGGIWVRVVQTCRETVAAQRAGFLLQNVVGYIPAAEPAVN